MDTFRIKGLKEKFNNPVGEQRDLNITMESVDIIICYLLLTTVILMTSIPKIVTHSELKLVYFYS